jgi:hypothetical protein
MNRIMKGVAGIAVGALAVSGVALVTASSANAASSSNTNAYQCVTDISPAGVFNASTQPDYTIALDAPSVTPGNDIVITGSYSPALNNGPVALANYEGSNRISVSYQVNGGAVQTVDGAFGATSAPTNVASGAPVPNPAPGAITIDGSGLADGDVVTILPTSFRQNLASTALGGVSGFTNCVPVGGDEPANALTVNVLNAASASITAVSGQSNPAFGRSGGTATVTGSDWGPSAGNTFTKQNCDVTGTTCGTSAAAAGLSVTGSTLSGTVAVGGNALGTGARSFKITASPSGQSVVIPINILGTRSASISPSQGGTGTTVTVTVSNFDTGSDITAFGASDAAIIAAGPPGCAPGCNILIPTVPTADIGATTTASATGTGTATVTITDSATVAVGAVQGSSLPALPWGASTPVGVLEFAGSSTSNFTFGVNSCTIDADGLPAPQCSLIQFIEADVEGGVLTLSQLDGSVTLTPITLNGSAQQATGAINQLTITDARGTDVGWAITGALTDFENSTVLTGSNRVIPAENMAWTPSCAAVAGTTGTPDPGAAGNFATGLGAVVDPLAASADANAGLCSLDAGEGGGTFTADAGLSLTVPATVQAGLYTATLYLQIA